MASGFDWPTFAAQMDSYVNRVTGRRRRRFDAGEMKYVILKVLEDTPRHGYDVMKEIQTRLGGWYTPSPGTVYPTLQWLDDAGLVRGREDQGRRVYEITDEGRQFLRDNKGIVEEIFERVHDTVERAAGSGMSAVHKATGRLVKEVYRASWRRDTDETCRRIGEILDRATADIQGLRATQADVGRDSPNPDETASAPR
ncbi:MAG: PadR family transcriptional regulator [Luteitalea sp.]|nr:PadR family transcriptional regulator [Luteitalea sp.]